ncbi:MAG: S8 family serine peptidase [Planctomycetes bacterium]|nr:S8 family serine peptidase [Planctomycetota bacterium]
MHTRSRCVAASLLLGSLAAPSLLAQQPVIHRFEEISNLAYDGRLVASTKGEILDVVALPFLSERRTDVVLWTERDERGERRRFAIAPEGQAFAPASDVEGTLHLRYATFDPLRGEPQAEPGLQQLPLERLFLVQFETQSLQEYRDALAALGAEVHQYVPHQAFVVRMDPRRVADVRELPFVRWVGPYHAGYRLQAELLEKLRRGDLSLPRQRYNLVVISKSDKLALMSSLVDLGAEITNPQDGSILLEAALDGAQLLAAAHLDQVLWIDRWTAPEVDMDNARIQSGANYIQSVAGFTGRGVRGEIYEGVDGAHPDYAAVPGVRQAPIVHGCGTADTHGNCTFGIVFGSGAGNAAARGMAWEGQGIYANYGCTGTSRYAHVGELVNPSLPYQGMHQTASWGGGRNRVYDSVSADMDNIIMDHDITITQSQSNAGNQDSRPQAWAKNVISVGGVRHGDNSNPLDDNWTGSGSTGPAEDGRIKPDISAYYDAILTTDLVSGGYASGNYYTGFGGTSGATPIVAGATLLIHQMWTEGIFGNTLPNPGGSRFSNRGHFSTMKALLLASARQYAFSGTTHDLTRTNIGWGFPDLQFLYNSRQKMLVVNEEDVLTNLQTKSYSVTVASGEPELRVVLCYVDKEGTTSATQHRINNVDLKVTSPTGLVYWGNNGLLAGNWSTAGGVANTKDTVECVLLQNPPAGSWTIEVIAAQLNQDTHLETPGIDQDFGLVAMGVRAEPPCTGTTQITGTGCRDIANIFGFVLNLSIAGTPCLGENLTIDVSASPFNSSPQIYAFGGSSTSWSGVPLPFSLDGAGAPGCSIYSDIGIAIPVPNPGSGSPLAIGVPIDGSIVGAPIFVQSYFLSPTANALGLASSNLLRIVLGL